MYKCHEPQSEVSMPLLDMPVTARRSDPVQSFVAADKKNQSKTLSTDRLLVLAAVAGHPGFTAKELDTLCHLNGKAHRRAPELEVMGLIEREKNGSEMTLYVTEKGKRIINNITN